VNDITTHPTFVNGFLAVTNIVFAFIAHVSFFGIISEMEDPRQFPKSLAMLQIVDTTMYVVAAMVIYCYVGPDVSSPALSAAGPVMKKVAYGLAIPTVRLAYASGVSKYFLTFTGYRRWCRFWTRCMQVHLCPHFPR
jgi:amino acid permease